MAVQHRAACQQYLKKKNLWCGFTITTHSKNNVDQTWDDSTTARNLFGRREVWRHNEVGCTRNRTLGEQQ